jgi:hypothetical protein
MAGFRGILTAFIISNALVAVPMAAQSRGFASLTHTVSVTVPARVKVQVASLTAASIPVAASVSSVPISANGLSLTVRATQAWVLSLGSAETKKSQLQWSPDGRSQFSSVTNRDVPVASGVSSGDATAANMFFRSAASAAALNGNAQGETVVLTVSAP